MNGILLTTMDKTRPLVNAGELDAADALITYLNAHQASLDESGAASLKELSDRSTQFREILKTANKTKNGARDGRSCDPISALAKDIPAEAAGMIEKIEKLKQSCLHNLSVVPDTL